MQPSTPTDSGQRQATIVRCSHCNKANRVRPTLNGQLALAGGADRAGSY